MKKKKTVHIYVGQYNITEISSMKKHLSKSENHKVEIRLFRSVCV